MSYQQNNGYQNPQYPSGQQPTGYPQQQQGGYAPNPYQQQQPQGGYTQQGYAVESAELSTARNIMNNELCGCCTEVDACIFSLFLPCIVNGLNYSNSNTGSFCIGCCCAVFTVGCTRSGVQRYVGVNDEGCIMGCLYHIVFGPCAMAQEYKSIRWVQKAAQGNYQGAPGGTNMY